MKVPTAAELPLAAPAEIFEIDARKIAEFQRAFGESLDAAAVPPTLGAMTLKGVFTIVNSLEVDWRNLLHASQKFEYLQKISPPCSLSAVSRLIDLKFRAQMYWMNFETEVRDVRTSEIVIVSKSLLMVKTS